MLYFYGFLFCELDIEDRSECQGIERIIYDRGIKKKLVQIKQFIQVVYK